MFSGVERLQECVKGVLRVCLLEEVYVGDVSCFVCDSLNKPNVCRSIPLLIHKDSNPAQVLQKFNRNAESGPFMNWFTSSKSDFLLINAKINLAYSDLRLIV